MLNDIEEHYKNGKPTLKLDRDDETRKRICIPIDRSEFPIKNPLNESILDGRRNLTP